MAEDEVTDAKQTPEDVQDNNLPEQPSAAEDNVQPAPDFDANGLNEYYNIDNIRGDAATMFDSFIEQNYTPEQQQIIKEKIQEMMAKNGGDFAFKMSGIGDDENDYVKVEYADGKIKSFKLYNKDQEEKQKLQYKDRGKSVVVKGKEKLKEPEIDEILKLKPDDIIRTSTKQKMKASATGAYRASSSTDGKDLSGAVRVTEKQKVKGNEDGVDLTNSTAAVQVTSIYFVPISVDAAAHSEKYHYDENGNLRETTVQDITNARIGIGGIGAGYKYSNTEYQEDGTAQQKNFGVDVALDLSGITVAGGISSIELDKDFYETMRRETNLMAGVSGSRIAIQAGTKLNFIDPDGNIIEKGGQIKTQYGYGRILCAAGCYVRTTDTEGNKDISQNGFNVDLNRVNGIMLVVEKDGKQQGLLLSTDKFIEMMEAQGYKVDKLKEIMQTDFENYTDVVRCLASMVVKTPEENVEEQTKEEQPLKKQQRPNQQNPDSYMAMRKYRKKEGGRP